MRIDILTVVPELLTSPLNESILHRAQEKGLVQIVVHNLHDYAHDRRKTTDDYRIREHLVTREISIGDYVLTGGELAACIIADSVVRIIPGAIGDEASALTDSFQDNLLAPPVYTRPAEFRGWRVPDVLLSGNFAQIARWQEEQSYQRTRQLRPDLLNE